MNAEVAKARFDLLFAEINEANRRGDEKIVEDFFQYLERDYQLIDTDKARDLAREGNL